MSAAPWADISNTWAWLFVLGACGSQASQVSEPHRERSTLSQTATPSSNSYRSSASVDISSAGVFSPLQTSQSPTTDTGEKKNLVLPPIPPNTAVLHIGDSFTLAGFAQALSPRMKALKVRYEVKSEQSSFTVTWAPRMPYLIANLQPNLVIISLGANEIANTDPSTHAGAVRRLVKAIGGRPCVWVTPPLWKKDTGIIQVIQSNVAPCRFFDSDKWVKEPIERQKDGIHPNEKGGAVWASAFWDWLQSQRAPADASTSPWDLLPASAEEYETPNVMETSK